MQRLVSILFQGMFTCRFFCSGKYPSHFFFFLVSWSSFPISSYLAMERSNIHTPYSPSVTWLFRKQTQLQYPSPCHPETPAYTSLYVRGKDLNGAGLDSVSVVSHNIRKNQHTAPQEPQLLPVPSVAAPHLGHEACPFIVDSRCRSSLAEG